MKRLVAGVCALLALCACAHDPFASFRGAKYEDVRQALLEQGFVPYPTPWPDRDEACSWYPELCGRFPELSDCSSTGPAFCLFLFRRGTGGRFIRVEVDRDPGPGFGLVTKLMEQGDDQMISSYNDPNPPLGRTRVNLPLPETYEAARAELASWGIRPIVHASRVRAATCRARPQICTRYPEVHRCYVGYDETQPGNEALRCDYLFQRDDGVYFSLTGGGEPGSQGQHAGKLSALRSQDVRSILGARASGRVVD